MLHFIPMYKEKRKNAFATDLEETLETNSEKFPDAYLEDNNVTPHYDVILQVKP